VKHKGQFRLSHVGCEDKYIICSGEEYSNIGLCMIKNMLSMGSGEGIVMSEASESR